jgi:formylglycine-generating enzyme required for sulfatase activity
MGLALLLGAHQPAAQESQFFRISGPTATTIIAFKPDGTLIWTNAEAGTDYTVQSASSLLGSWVDYIQLPVTNRVNTNQVIAFYPPAGMAFVPAGTFTMGNVIGDQDITDANPAKIYISAFVMDVNLVNYGLWTNVYAFATNHGYRFANAGLTGTGGETGFGVTPTPGNNGSPVTDSVRGKDVSPVANLPVGKVDWFDCVKWCNARSQQAGLTPVYYTDAVFTQVFTNGETNLTVYQNLTVNGYRLPTEAEWEKAARAGEFGLRFPWGNTIQANQAYYQCQPYSYSYDMETNCGNGETNYPTGPSLVGSFSANGYGLYDMAGSMFEWCWDWYGNKYGIPTAINPTGVPSSSSRVLRGGSWGSGANMARCANRYSHGPTITHIRNCNGTSRKTPIAPMGSSSSRRARNISAIQITSPAVPAGKRAANGLIIRRPASPRATCTSSNTASSSCARALILKAEAGHPSGCRAPGPWFAGLPAARLTSWNVVPARSEPTLLTRSTEMPNGRSRPSPLPIWAVTPGPMPSTFGRWNGMPPTLTCCWMANS